MCFLPRPQPLSSKIDDGRAFVGSRKVRLGDVDPSGRLRLDALTRYTQDVSDDDTTDAGLAPEPGWVVRSTTVDEIAPASLGEQLTFVTYCSALGKRWAERRLTIAGDQGAQYEVATLWICVDTQTNGPTSLTDQFLDIYASAAGGRKASARLRNPKPVVDSGHHDLFGDIVVEPWPVRRVDFDVYGHVNNAAYWAAVEQLLPTLSPEWASQARRFRLEYAAGITEGYSVNLVRATNTCGLAMWWMTDSGSAGSLTACAL